MNIRAGEYVLLTLFVTGLTLLSACRTGGPRPSSEGEVSPAYVEVTTTVGRILKVNEKHGYVVIECVSLPSRGEGAIVYDGDRVAGRLRITELINSPFVVADITEGVVAPGETVKIIRRKRVKTVQEEGRK